MHPCGNLKKPTRRKFFGSYYHSLTGHCPQQYWVISGQTSNTESEEATFNSLKTFTNLTSNHHPDHIVLNALIQTQTKEALTPHRLKIFKEEKVFKNLYLPIKEMLTNTLIPFIWIKKYFRDYQILLENIADYLIDETQWLVEDDSGLKFLDLSEIEFSKELHHFRSSTIKPEEDFTNDC